MRGLGDGCGAVEDIRGDMNQLLREKIKVVADRNVCSLEQARGFVDGETARRRGKPPTRLTLVGIDEYCLGFRAGYFERRQPGAARPSRFDAQSRESGFAETR